MLNLALDLVTTYWVINLPLIIPFAKRNIREYACQVYLRKFEVYAPSVNFTY